MENNKCGRFLTNQQMAVLLYHVYVNIHTYLNLT
uniref:Uncharacterized protein n=1 Tax=Anguilla anguilla TaxID=7936 RepID=A0A0E9XCS1_ANGAN